MDKNVSGVDLEELMKAREELNKERGIETDPNMYSGYNPNRESGDDVNNKESSQTSEQETTQETSAEVLNVVEDSEYSKITEESNQNNVVNFENSRYDSLNNNSGFADGYSSEEKKKEESVSQSSAIDNLSKYDAFAAFEVKENSYSHADDKTQRTTNLDSLEQELMKEIIADESVSPETNESTNEEDKDVEDLETILDNLLADIDSEIDSINNENSSTLTEETDLSSENKKSEENIVETKNELNSLLQEETKKEEISDNLPNIDIELKFKEFSVEPENDSIENKNDGSKTSSEIEEKKDAEVDDYLSELLNSDENLEQKNIETKVEDKDFIQTNKTEIDNKETENLDISDNEEVDNYLNSLTSEETGESELDKTSSEEDKITSEDYLNDLLSKPEDETSNQIVEIFEKKENHKVESEEIENYDASKARVTHQTYRGPIENTGFDGDTEIITDYSQLREILQKELRESELDSKDKLEEDDGIKYQYIEDTKFINEIATDDFRSSDKFSYILGKNEDGEIIYGNFREHFNLAVFGKNEVVTNALLNSMILSLCLKNNTTDINFVMLDSDINSSFEIYNKSSYLYFNRIAKTNKEILDTLIEITKEVDERYEKLANNGMNNIEQFNDMAKETSTTPMPYLIVVFNNYTSSSQATYIDKINACLYQILKFGRIVGVYAVVTAMLPIETNQVNYNLSSRISFKSDRDSKYTVGVGGVEKLPDENDAIYFNISKNSTEHIKTVTITETELDLIIKELED